MRVTHIITRLIVGGAQENTVDSVLGLRRRHGLDADLISGPTTGPEGSLEPAFAGLPGVLTIAPHLVRPVRPVSDGRALLELTRLLRARRPDLVHTHSGKAGILGRLAARRAGIPIILHTIHGPSFGPFQGALANTVFSAAERWAARCTTHFISVAHAMTRQYLDAGIGQPDQFTRILSGFALEPFLSVQPDPAARRRYGLAPGDFVVGKIARLAPLKGHDDLLEAASRLLPRTPHLKFLLVGDGPERVWLEQAIQARGWQRQFCFTGLVAPSEIPGLLGLMDAVVHLSRREGLPRALSQALAAAKPVVAYDCDGASEVCLQEETGFLVAPGDLAGLAGRLEQLAADPALRERLGQRGRALVREHFSLERMVDDLHALYQRMIAAHSPRGSSPTTAQPR
jgi:glycosyltransferase involved in cell wall biosynthesis